MRVRLGDLRKFLKEEDLHGVPEWRLRQDTSDFVDRVRERCTQFILINKSQTSLDRQEAIMAMNDTCDQLEEKVYDVLEQQLWSFLRRV